MKFKFLFLALLLGLFAVNADAQAVLGGGGACHVSANPNTVVSIAAQTNQGCKLALDVTNNILYWYNDANAAGAKWQVLPTAAPVDGSITNEGLLGVTAGAATTSVLQGYNLAGTAVGLGVTLTAGAGITIAETVSTNGGTITLAAAPIVYTTYYASDAAATTGGILLNTPYALDNPNIYGLPKGLIKVRQ